MEKKPRSFTQLAGISLRGLAMGAADVIPGVSGGTIAFITGIYEELIGSISNINLEALKKLKNEGVISFWKHVNGNFFVALLIGIAISILSLARVVTYLLDEFPVLLWAFFFGLIRSEEHTSELQSRPHLVCRLLLEKKKKKNNNVTNLKTYLVVITNKVYNMTSIISLSMITTTRLWTHSDLIYSLVLKPVITIMYTY